MDRRPFATVSRWDVQVSARIGATRLPPVLERGLPLITRAADKSKLWMGISAVLAGSGNTRARRAAVRGLGSIAVASLLANQVGKRMVPRRRPLLRDVPIGRIAHHVPTSSSFPSGHSASAAAFAVATAAEFPELAVPIGALAGAVCFSRIFTGVHFTSDVLAGAALGATVAGIGVAAVPAHHPEPVRLRIGPERPQPPRPDGRGVVTVVSLHAGGGNNDGVAGAFREVLPAAEVVELGPDDDVAEAMKAAAARAEVLGVIGGDGTVNAAATAAAEAGIPLLVVPAGTFNHFARDLELDEVPDAVDALTAGRAVAIDVGEVDGELFLNTASLGSYPEFVKIRERWEGRFGKPLAATWAILHVLRHCPPLAAEVDGVQRRLVMIFIGNGRYSPRGYVPRWRAGLDSGQLDIRLVDSARSGSWWRLLLAALTGDMYRTSRYLETRTPSLTVTIDGPPGYLARDGEVTDAPSTVTFSVRREALTVYCGPPR
ncbi:bifunctional phosphatase PAP2/diacylglycerol kinase family protein [Jatrophihabitans sp.]|uniref:bifunctional phosphatase PAP2/diacylglycerol kinase family protein n=1 Tax=Jatrophihabitans sp. TaxID=1932789 RepID=UPI002B941D03|nr:phosphatase PAP2 family protein [Jatrophihabitans sp.]